MKRDMEKTIREFKEITGEHEAFYYSDITQLREMAKRDGGDEMNTLYYAIVYALEVGYATGYKAAEKKQGLTGQEKCTKD